MIPLRQSTAASVLIGPILDNVGTVYTGAAVGDLQIAKNGSVAALNGSATLTHSHQGMYVLALTTSDTDTIGRATVSLSKATYVMRGYDYTVMDEPQYDALFAANGTDYLNTDLAQWLGVAPLALSAYQVQSVVPTTQKVDVETIKTRAVTCDASVTISPYVGNATAVIVVDTLGNVAVDTQRIANRINRGAI